MQSSVAIIAYRVSDEDDIKLNVQNDGYTDECFMDVLIAIIAVWSHVLQDRIVDLYALV